MSFLCKKIFPILFLLSALFLLFCSQPEPTRVPVNSDEFCSGDTLCVRLRYELKDDTAALSYGTGLEITMQLRNTAARALTLDSLPVETYVEIVPDSSGNPSSVFRSPFSYPDTALHVITLDAGDTLQYRVFWHRTNYMLQPVPPGAYLIRGAILGFPVRELEYTLL